MIHTKVPTDSALSFNENSFFMVPALQNKKSRLSASLDISYLKT
jgi:hypothetical protein